MRSVLITFALLALGILARDDHILIHHPDAKNWCKSARWQHFCHYYAPKTAHVLSSLCEPGDYDGSNPQNTTRVVCSVTTGAPKQLTLITQLVANKLGATPAVGPPQGAC